VNVIDVGVLDEVLAHVAAAAHEHLRNVAAAKERRIVERKEGGNGGVRGTAVRPSGGAKGSAGSSAADERDSRDSGNAPDDAPSSPSPVAYAPNGDSNSEGTGGWQGRGGRLLLGLRASSPSLPSRLGASSSNVASAAAPSSFRARSRARV
jgi:hypothetical protein